ncbi:MAG: DNA translocase FtsK [Chlorobi bacterium]|nr:DNA translocase FtsK [Chlorobiota bacterium]
MSRTRKKKKRTPTSRGHWRTIAAAVAGMAGLMLAGAQISYLFNWKADFSALDWSAQSEEARNIFGKIGAFAGFHTVFKGYGAASLLLAAALLITAYYVFKRKSPWRLLGWWLKLLIALWLISWLLAMVFPSVPVAGGVAGLEWVRQVRFYAGKGGAWLLWLLLVAVVLAYFLKIRPEQMEAAAGKLPRMPKMRWPNIPVGKKGVSEGEPAGHSPADEPPPGGVPPEGLPGEEESQADYEEAPEYASEEEVEARHLTEEGEEEMAMEGIKVKVHRDEVVDTAARLVEEYGEFDPTLELGSYEFPHLDLLKEYKNVGVELDPRELQRYRAKILKIFEDFRISIEPDIEVTVGPTVTLYEIKPSPGTRIKTIKSLEDDIALALAAHGVRIIAPMPGKNTIGIEVANKNPTLVPLREVLRTPQFQRADMELPIALGKNIAGRTFVFDLAAMPHLLIAGATGQGKSVGLNVIINSLLFKKHPAELKFVMVDPKKVELSLYNKIEKHFLAKLPNEAEAIISDPMRVKHTLHSLIQEVDNRLNLFKKAEVRKIAEYNRKFRERRLNPANGHRFLPYIVVIIDEFADFIYSAGKEVQVPLIKLAQISRAVGIHMVIATQRPSVDIITGVLKAQFPGRIAFRTASQIDSRTILDQKGAEKLIGRGDMLFRTDLGVTRLQCAYIDTEEVANVTDFIAAQPGYPSAYPLPEVDEGEGTAGLADDEDRDPLFKEAAYIVVERQQGSASLLQRHLQIGYPRAGKLIDQLYRAGIVGPPDGSKPRKVNIPDIVELEKFLNAL